MLSKIMGCGIKGITGHCVEVETYISNGIPCLEIVGQADNSVKESKERVKAAIKNSGYEYPNRKIVVNLSPALLRKEGTGFDLPIALGILVANGQVVVGMANGQIAGGVAIAITDTMFVGELSLDGSVKGVCGVVSMMLAARNNGAKLVFVPAENYGEAAIVEDMQIVGVSSLLETINYLEGAPLPNSEKFYYPGPEYAFGSVVGSVSGPGSVVGSVSGPGSTSGSASASTLASSPNQHQPDFCEVRGHAEAKRALEIAASGGHSILMIGSPGSGKTMLARRFAGILPEMSYPEALETTQIHSISGKSKVTGLILQRPFRSPHHSCTVASLTGGGQIPRPGEITMAHNGVLFLDELPEYRGEALEALRQPLEDGFITVSRLLCNETFPSKVMLICAANPCKCGFLFEEGRCKCSPYQKSDYLSKISGPLLDRIDMNIQVASVSYSQLDSNETLESSAQIKCRVAKARQIQEERYKDEKFNSNSWLPLRLFKKYCQMSEEASNLLEKIYSKKKFSGREYTRVIRVARTIADMMGSDIIDTSHISEAIQYKILKLGEAWDYARESGESSAMDLVFLNKRVK